MVVLRALGLGGLLTAVPALRSLRTSFPGHRIELAAPARYAALLERDGLVDEIVDCHGLDEPIATRSKPAIAVNLHGSGPESHRLLMRLRPFRLVGYANAEVGVLGPLWQPAEHERRRWSRLVTQSLAARYAPDRLDLSRPDPVEPAIIAHPGAADAARRWPLECWVHVVRELREGPVVITGDPGEAHLGHRLAEQVPLGRESVLAGQTGILALARLVASARLVLSTDTGIAHLASAFGTPSVTLFGPDPPSRCGPPARGPHTSIWRPDGTSPLRPDEPHPALLRIQPEDVVRAARQRLRTALAHQRRLDGYRWRMRVPTKEQP